MIILYIKLKYGVNTWYLSYIRKYKSFIQKYGKLGGSIKLRNVDKLQK